MQAATAATRPVPAAPPACRTNGMSAPWLSVGRVFGVPVGPL